jgi:hypothetical protein
LIKTAIYWIAHNFFEPERRGELVPVCETGG